MVVVELDAVAPSEMEFFSLLARWARGTEVYVYGSAASERRIAEAVERGARGRLTLDAFGEPVRAPQHPTPSAVTGPPVEAVSPVNPEVAVSEEPQPPLSPETEGDEDFTDEAESAPTTGVRVPWLRYGEGPPRVAPPVRTAPYSQTEPHASAARSLSDYEPLLTEEELAALMADDISSLAPTPYSAASSPTLLPTPRVAP